MMVHVCRGEGEAHNFPLNSAIYTCGSCSVTFTTICTLHDHILDYELGGSFYYDGFTKTAFPKHRTAIAETQTGWKERQEDQDIFRRFLDRQSSGKQIYENVKTGKPGKVSYHVSDRDVDQQKITVEDKGFYQLENMCTNTNFGSPDNDEKTGVGLNTGIILSHPNNTVNVHVNAPLDETDQINGSEKQVTNNLRLETKSELDIDAALREGEYSDGDSDREYADFLDEQENKVDADIACNLVEDHQDVIKQIKNELNFMKTETVSSLETITESNNRKSVIEGHVIIKTESIIEPEKQNRKHTLDNVYVELKILKSTQNDSEHLKQKKSETSQLVAKIKKKEKIKKDVTLSKKTGRRKTQPLFDPLSREPKVDIEDTFFKRSAAQQSRYHEKKKETVKTEETHITEKCTTTRNKPRKSYHYSSEEEESDELDEKVLAMRKDRDAALSAQRKGNPPSEREKDPNFLPMKKKRKVTLRCESDDRKPKGKQKAKQPNISPVYNEDNNKDNELEKKAFVESKQADTMYTCNICQVAMDVSLKTKHKKTHKKQQTVICYVCGISVEHSKLDYHIRTNHRSSETPFTCEICGKRLQTKGRLNAHIRFVHTVGSHNCKYCERTFHLDSLAQEHMQRFHTGERNHLCPHCGKAFVTNYECKKHAKTVHIKIKPHECKLCFTRFARISYYNRHMETHAETRTTFECMYCNRKLLDKKSLLRHLQIHTGENKNSCHLCDYSTIQRQCLAKHMANCHGLAQEQIQGILTEMKNKNKRKYINDM